MIKPIPIRIILADDHEIFRDGFAGLFRDDEEIVLVAEARNGIQLLAMVDQHQPDVVLTDIKMPEMDGVAATKEIGRLYPAVNVIALSMFDDDAHVVEMLQAGAIGYLLKNAHKKEIIEAIHAVHRGEAYYCSQTSFRMARLIAATRLPRDQRSKVVFSEKEKEVMQYICREFNNMEISEALHLSVRTIEGYRKSILEKSGARNMIGAVIYAIRQGIYQP